ncbi:MAG: cupin domain-containing protein [Alphaproteobacteria bacterium]
MLTAKTKLWRGLSAAAILAGGLALTATGASAGECPANMMRVDATKPVMTPAKDVTDKVLASIDLSKEKVALNGHQMRVRKLEIQPGGVVPWHSHGARPALIYIIQGEIYEYASNCAVPILHKTGDVARETHMTSHWWKNTGKTAVVLLSFDIMHDDKDKNM